ncbi:hypothetical protein PQJ75_17550 [Rhodoplanes sp. TEM]|uniref:DUF1254 domain-containing protein n=1 Tax=Rhodoplanes tepidamans TaxID=200616 RepID=A0ABT5JCJ5_RHOTP|nr:MULTISPECIES: hypothetical protein [Rhodoplanes]MDC7787420.1 hypothetical protein [Rhodoplanes tepidamans]MDC7985539.1 hypothetical protein [Rhodoplanes sp. TEM]MDQ0358094.1 hypothetical protein [Rhodoplanes tepidamans]
MSIRTVLAILAGAALACVWAVVSYPLVDYVDNALYWRRVRSDTDVAGVVGRLGNTPAFEFARAAAKAGLTRSEGLKGIVDAADVLPDGRLKVAGWAVDTRKGNRPVDVVIVAPKVAVFVVRTTSPRDDVADYLLFPADYIKAGFAATFDEPVGCAVTRAGAYVVVVNQDLQFDIVNPQLKINGC